ncbi:flagellar motor switch phosphatase FliY [Syntrophomonas wolfei]|mgnify:CR=1 FL=1|jgi:flagellar motor switch protein FliN/FliY|uniref:flagellar motor switch phosphatase FliY n=1 Tax=Syntrophomonas wolfei TaxID=863 RepID=UPI0023F1D137|nr:flagellar motor switch phosphatase FliY [Syntrophomonas wolfei]
MNDGILSQEEIDALLTGGSSSGTDTMDSSSEPVSTSSINLSDFEKDTLGEVGNISMGTAATTLSTLLRQKVSITTPDVSVTNPEELQLLYPLPFVVVEVSYTRGLTGTNVLVIKENDAAIIADLMMGGDGLSAQGKSLGDLELSAVGEAMNQMMGSATTSLSSMFNRRIDIAPPQLTVIDMGKESLQLSTNFHDVVKIKFKMEIENLINSEIMQIIPMEAVENIMSILMGSTAEESSAEAVMEEPPAMSLPETKAAAVAAPRQAETAIPSPPQEAIYSQAFVQSPREINTRPQFAVQPVQFAPLQESDMIHSPQNLDLIMDVPLDVSVELGKTKKSIREILELNQGAIIQLDKLAGEPVDLLVNGKLIAKGEVVVIDENYGIRITTIISPIDRMNKLQ